MSNVIRSRGWRGLLIVLVVLIIIYAGTMLYQVYKPLPNGLSMNGNRYMVPADSVTFFADRTYMQVDGERRTDQEIFGEVFQMIRGAQEYVLVDMFLFNAFQGSAPERTRALSSELTDVLVTQMQMYPDMQITVVSDPINAVYGGFVSPEYERLREAGVQVVVTDLTALRDSNPMYSAGWRMFLQWFGNSDEGGILPHPLAAEGDAVSIRSWLSLLNFKANHRKLIVADVPQEDGARKLATLVSSANPHDGSSAHSNVAVRVDDKVWRDVIASEQAVGGFSDENISGFDGDIVDEDGDVVVQLLTEGAIRETLIDLIDVASSGDSIDMAMFYLSERSVVRALIRAAQRGVTIRIILDANKDAFGHTKIGVPNRPVAHELVSKTDEAIKVRWCNTHGEQCHSKLSLFTIDGRYTAVLGSANITRRNIDNYNLETNLVIESNYLIPALSEAYEFFEEFWSNNDGIEYSVEYDVYADWSLWKRLVYRMQEATGLSSF